MKVAYIRVSTIDQNADRQLEAMKNQGIERFFEESASAKDAKRPKLQEMLEYVREGDTIYIKDFSRLARSVKDLLDIVESLNKKRVNLVSLKESIDSSTPTGKLMLTMVGAIYEFERSNLLERQKEGIAIAKTKGRYKGRKQIDFPKEWNEVYSIWKNRGITGTEAMNRLKLKRSTFYRLIKEQEAAK